MRIARPPRVTSPPGLTLPTCRPRMRFLGAVPSYVEDIMTNKAAYRAPEMISEEKLRAAREEARRSWSVNLIPLVPVVALLIGAAIYWIATTTDTNKIFGPSVAEHSSKR